MSDSPILIFAFFGVAFLYLLVAQKIDYCMTIRLLGFHSSCPAAFLTNPSLYHWTSWALFIAAWAIGLFSSLPGLVIAATMGILWLYSGYSGRQKAFNKYRENIQSIRAYAKTDKDRQECDELLAKTDAQLQEEADLANKLGR